MASKFCVAIPESRCTLTKESKNSAGVVTAALSDLDGNPIQDDGVKYAGDHPAQVSTYVDAMTGKRVASISLSKAGELIKAGKDVLQGLGAVGGFFVSAPDPMGAAPTAPPAPQGEKKVA